MPTPPPPRPPTPPPAVPSPDRRPRRAGGRWKDLLAAAVVFALGIAPALYCVNTTARTVALAGDRPTADAEVLARRNALKGNGVTVTVRFTTADGRTVTATVHELRRPPPPVGGPIRVRYNEKRPQYVRAADAGPAVGMPVFAGIVAVLAFGCGIALGVRVVRPRRLVG